MKWLRCSSRNSLKKTNPQSGRQNRPLFCMSGSAAVATCLCLAFGTGEGHLWYGICVPCAKRLPGVRDAFSEAFGVKNRLLRYGRDIRCQKQPSVVRDAFSKALRTADSTDCGQPPGVRDAFSEAYRAKSSTCRTGCIFSARNGPRSEVIRLKRGRPLSLSRLFGPVSYFDGIVRSPEAAYCLLISS